MHYVLADDSVPFDGHTSGRRPLGGAEKGFAQLAAALVRKGHDVTVLNRTPFALTTEAVDYRPLNEVDLRAEDADVLIAFRRPQLLGAARKARHRLLWVTAPPAYLDAEPNKTLWRSFSPTVLFISEAQRATYHGPLPNHLLMPGVAAPFYETPSSAASPWAPTPPETTPRTIPPHAIVTTHPLHGLAWLLEIWRRLINPQMPEARLVIYSATLSKGMRDEEIDPAIMPLVDRIKSVGHMNVVVSDPRGDQGMADVYRNSRVHLYPGHPQDFGCWTLAESQAAGVPAVARAMGGVDEYIINGTSGFLVPDASAFANVALEILRNDAVHASQSAAALDVSRRRTWDMVAADLDEIVANLPRTTS